MNAIVSVTANWGIGLDNHLLVRNKADMARFVELTMGHTVLMGRKTLESFPGGPLKGRRNVCVSRDVTYAPEGVEVYHGWEEALEALADLGPDDVWLIGGASAYDALLDRCERVFATKNDVTVPADTYFPNLDESPAWTLESEDGCGTTNAGIDYVFCTYRHVSH